MYITNNDLLKVFLEGGYAKNRNLESVGDKLINYKTVIAFKENGIVFMNSRKYSVTTSKIQNKLISYVLEKNLNHEFYRG